MNIFADTYNRVDEFRMLIILFKIHDQKYKVLETVNQNLRLVQKSQNANISLTGFFRFCKKLDISAMFFPVLCVFCNFDFFCICIITFELI